MFKFKLQAVLQQRVIQEETRQREFSLVQQQAEALKERQQKLSQTIEQRGAQVRERQKLGMALAEREIYERYITGQHMELRSLDAESERLRKALELSRQKLVEALRQRKMMEELRELHEKQYRLEENKAELRMFDEIAIRDFAMQSRWEKDSASPERISQ